MAADLVAVENRLWAAADQLWANTGLKPSEFSTPVLGLIFLRYADKRFTEAQVRLTAKGLEPDDLEPYDYQAEGVLYLPDEARFSYLCTLTEGDNLGKAINNAMALVEANNDDLKGVLPRSYNNLPNPTLVELLRLLAPVDLEGDAFGKVYEYFLGKFAMKEGQKGGVFYTPTSIVRLIVEIIEPYHGRIFDPACGSGGMFVQSAAFVERHHKRRQPRAQRFGTEKASDTVRLAKMNLAVHGLSGEISEANSYYDDPHKSVGHFDFVMANPPFNVSGVDKDRLKATRGFRWACPRRTTPTTCGFSYFASALNEKGRAGFVMANSAGDARGSELEIRKQLIESGAVDVIVSVGTELLLHRHPTVHVVVPRQGQGARRQARATKCCSSMPAHIYRQVTRAIATSPRSRSSTSPTSCGCTAARSRSSRRVARRHSTGDSPSCAMRMWLDCAR